MGHHLLSVAVAVVLAGLTSPEISGQSASGASKPDFSGTWILNATKSEKALAQGLSPVRGRMTITVSEKSVTFVNVIPGEDGKPIIPAPGGFSERTTVCAFGDTPAENIRPEIPLMCSVKWDGNRLVTSSFEPTYPLALKGTRSRGTGTYEVNGSELTVSSVVPRAKGGDPFAATVFWDRAK